MRKLVLTGGPGAGKTAVLEALKRRLCKHVAILPESAGILFSGGFWRLPNQEAKLCSQRAIYQVQKEMENLVDSQAKYFVALCDRGTLDGLAYWPEDEETFFRTFQSSYTSEYSKYDLVIHLRTPDSEQGYNHQNPLRIETAEESKAIDEKIANIWRAHSNYKQVLSRESFIEKMVEASGLVEEFVGRCSICKK
ncbi:MAG: hypothetical protein COT74_11445 [Bdellovibrionales bacterium CG10_big_fil_rev_8_21_14_0_10_45_34]|nr:MAG: hypothetical protein COT74_11445 [Bdellovibrionales bacterium CG10_big_fil_rev_8_21_14_0_10_45_34]